MADPLNIVIDISHHNGNPDFQQAAAAGIVGVIHKATQGTGFTDSKYLTNRQKALDAGLLCGLITSAPPATARGKLTSFSQPSIQPRHSGGSRLRTKYARRNDVAR